MTFSMPEPLPFPSTAWKLPLYEQYAHLPSTEQAGVGSTVLHSLVFPPALTYRCRPVFLLALPHHDLLRPKMAGSSDLLRP